MNIPKITCPFPSLVNPHVDEAHTHSLWWSHHVGLVRTEEERDLFSKMLYAQLTARMFPFARLDDLLLICDWYTVLMLLDDGVHTEDIQLQFGGIQQFFQHLLAILTDVQTDPQHPFAQAFFDCWKRSIPCTTPTWRNRFIHHLTAFFLAFLWEEQNIAQKSVPHLEVYLKQRMYTSGMFLTLAMLDIAQNTTLPDYVYNCLEFQFLLRIVCKHFCLVNDLYSFPKERASGDFHNVVFLLQQASPSSLEDAIQTVMAMIEAETHRYEESKQRLPSFTAEIDHMLHQHVNAFPYCMRGHLEWYQESARYLQTTS